MATETDVRRTTADPDRTTADAVRTTADPRWWVLVVAGLGSFALLTAVIAGGATIPFDQPLLDAARHLPVDASIWTAISDTSNLPLIAVGIAIVAVLLLTGRRLEAFEVVVVLAVVTAGSELIKQLIARPRPPGGDVVVPGVVYSFPSGHVLEALTIFGMIAILLWRTGRHPLLARIVGLFAILFSALVALARVAINAHYPSDVLASYVAALGVIGLFALVARDRRHHQAEVRHAAEPAAGPAGGSG